MLSILASGTLVADPKQRQSANGKSYATASMRVSIDGEEAVLASLICFSDSAVAALLALAKGDVLAVSGRGKPLQAWASRASPRQAGQVNR